MRRVEHAHYNRGNKIICKQSDLRHTVNRIITRKSVKTEYFEFLMQQPRTFNPESVQPGISATLLITSLGL